MSCFIDPDLLCLLLSPVLVFPAFRELLRSRRALRESELLLDLERRDGPVDLSRPLDVDTSFRDDDVRSVDLSLRDDGRRSVELSLFEGRSFDPSRSKASRLVVRRPRLGVS